MAGVLAFLKTSAAVAPDVFGVINDTVHSIENIFGGSVSGADKKAAAMQAAAGILGLYNLGSALAGHGLSDEQNKALSLAIDSAVDIANTFGDFTHAPKTVQAS